jgi:hypothetical protein
VFAVVLDILWNDSMEDEIIIIISACIERNSLIILNVDTSLHIVNLVIFQAPITPNTSPRCVFEIRFYSWKHSVLHISPCELLNDQ